MHDALAVFVALTSGLERMDRKIVVQGKQSL